MKKSQYHQILGCLVDSGNMVLAEKFANSAKSKKSKKVVAVNKPSQLLPNPKGSNDYIWKGTKAVIGFGDKNGYSDVFGNPKSSPRVTIDGVDENTAKTIAKELKKYGYTQFYYFKTPSGDAKKLSV